MWWTAAPPCASARRMAGATSGRVVAEIGGAILPCLPSRPTPARRWPSPRPAGTAGRAGGDLRLPAGRAALLRSDADNGGGQRPSGIGDSEMQYQISAPVQQGSSGGPLLDLAGHVVGVIVSKLNAQRVAQRTGDIPQNVNFAVKGEEAIAFLRENRIEPLLADTAGPAQRRRGGGDRPPLHPVRALPARLTSSSPASRPQVFCGRAPSLPQGGLQRHAIRCGRAMPQVAACWARFPPWQGCRPCPPRRCRPAPERAAQPVACLARRLFLLAASARRQRSSGDVLDQRRHRPRHAGAVGTSGSPPRSSVFAPLPSTAGWRSYLVHNGADAAVRVADPALGIRLTMPGEVRPMVATRP